MRKIIFILIASIYTTICLGQTLENDSIQKEILNNKLKTNDNHQLYPRANERNIFDEKISVENKYNTNVTRPNNELEPPRVDMNIHVPEFYQGPIHNYLSNSRDPYIDDYSYSTRYGLSDGSWLDTRSRHSTFPVLGSISDINARYNYNVTDNFTVSAGTYISKYRLGYNSYNDAGINTSLRYNINDRISIHAFGQYSAFARKHKLDSNGPYEGMFPQTHFGGAFEYKITDRFGLMGGMKRELNPMTGKWNNTPFIVPVFYGK
ncbi:MAG: hypothetical protein E6772_11770 [Dysgonomonas sp.]|nr:hypothetical protein [Dysgonomonas sp.]